ncbi:MAG TPA: ferrous iron transport protein A [Clostridia bacterium]
MTLDRANRGEKLEIIEIEDSNIRAQALRLGISEGSCLLCSEKIPSGPIILKNMHQEVAVGRNLAKRIKVNRMGS